MEPTDWSRADDATLKALPATIARAEAGDPDAKQRLLDIFRAMVDSGRTPYPELLKYLSRHFSEALRSKAPAKVLGKALLGGPAHRRRLPEHDERDEALALAVRELIDAGSAELDAIHSVAERYGFTEGVVSHAWRRFKDSAVLTPLFPED